MRTENSIKNSITIIIPYIIIGILGFVKAKVFISNLSDDIYSLNQLFFQIIGYLSLAEAGFGVFIIQQYYKAFAKKDNNEVNSIFNTSVIYFRRLGIVILSLSIILSFFVSFLTKVNISTSYIQIVFILFVIKNIIDYFMMCPRDVISADQKLYKINWWINSVRIFESVVEITLAYLGVNYLLILVPGIIIRIIFNLIINKIVYKEYPWLTRENYKYNKKYTKGMSDLIFQKFAGVFRSNTDVILISTFVNPISVVVYTSYNYITKYIFDTIIIFAGALTPSYANALHEGNKEKSYSIFTELNIMFFFIAAFFSVILFVILNSFINLWIGSKYFINTIGLILIILVMFNTIVWRMMSIIINSEGLFKETKIVIILEAILNFIISIVLVHYIGINGVLVGTIVSTTLTTLWYIPYYIYKNIFHKNIFNYYKIYIFVLVIVIALSYLFKCINFINMNHVLGWILGGFVWSIISMIVLFAIFYLCFKSFRNLIKRFKYIIVSRQKRVGEK